jgi:hypothetical protein
MEGSEITTSNHAISYPINILMKIISPLFHPRTLISLREQIRYTTNQFELEPIQSPPSNSGSSETGTSLLNV